MESLVARTPARVGAIPPARLGPLFSASPRLAAVIFGQPARAPGPRGSDVGSTRAQSLDACGGTVFG